MTRVGSQRHRNKLCTEVDVINTTYVSATGSASVFRIASKSEDGAEPAPET